MATVYNLEPPPTAKCILKTTAGDIELSLFAKQTPLASRSFLQHLLDGYYTNSIFHRLVPGFIIQGGDPTGTGSGGISAINDGEPFQDEFHSRLKFNRRGLLGMANEGKDSNGSQYFFTLGNTPELQGKHTMFGRVEGDTIYNLMKMAEAELSEESSERPLYPTKILGAEILVNPFEDMVARVKAAPRVNDGDGKKEIKKRKKPAGKNVLSFGAEEGEEDVAQPVLKKAKANLKLVATETEEADRTSYTAMSGTPKEEKVKKSRPRKSPSPARNASQDEKKTPARAPMVKAPAKPSRSPSSSPEPERHTKATAQLDKTNAEIAALKASMKRNVDTTSSRKEERPKNALEALIPASSTRGRKRGKATDERGALDVFKAFKARLDDIPDSAPANAQPDDVQMANGHDDSRPSAQGDEDEEDLCDLHFIVNCQSCKNWNDQDEAEPDADDEGDTWMSHKLSFAKDTLGKDLEWKRRMEEIEIIDPREKAKAIKEESKRDRSKEGHNTMSKVKI